MKIDLHGQLGFEAEVNFTIFLSECESQKVKIAQVSHGYGKLVIRNIVWNILKNRKSVKNYYFAHPSLGGSGITIIEFF